MGEFETPFWQCWAPGIPNCLYAWCCGACANADIHAAAGTGSPNWLFNCCCVSIAVTRMLYRKEKGIDGTCMGDVCSACCCPVMALTQMVANLGDAFKMGNWDMETIKGDFAKGKDSASSQKGKKPVE